ncbi:VapC toxin family PIN domain ribonuclease [bacterium endosymbiont of Escarpia laminata]|nr:MAG: VapC toxin family PIN domain ribonuclease [bacterium endosymbiont of Escarpia laminata]
MRRYLLDTSALLTLRDDEHGADQVAEVLLQAEEHQAKVYGSFMTLMEVFYRVWKDEGETEGRVAYEQCKSLPIRWIHESSDLLEQVAKIKATHPLSLADAWIAATAILENGILIHKDPEFEVVDVEQHILPYK